MTTAQRLFVDDAVHKAIVAVNEKGTEAAAATALEPIPASAPRNTMRIDRPFVFLIRDAKTGTIVFLGRVLDPTSKP